MDKKTSLAIITQAARIYDSQLNNKNFLLIYGELRKPQHIELMFGAKNFHHLTGIVINKKHLFRDVHDKNSNELEVFYFKALNGKLHENDIGFKTDGTTEQKMRVLLQTLTISKSIKMYGDFVDNRVKLKTEKVAGGTNSFLGFVKSNGFYVPNTVIEGDIRNNVYTPYTVYGILSKSKDDTYYNQVITMKKNIDVDDLLTKVSNSVKIDKSIFLKMESTLQNSDIDKVHIVKFDNSINKPMNPVITDSAIPLALTPQNPFMDIINVVNSLGKKLQSVFAPEAKEHTSKFTAPKNYSKPSQPIPYTPKSKKTEAVKKMLKRFRLKKHKNLSRKNPVSVKLTLNLKNMLREVRKKTGALIEIEMTLSIRKSCSRIMRTAFLYTPKTSDIAKQCNSVPAFIKVILIFFNISGAKIVINNNTITRATSMIVIFNSWFVSMPTENLTISIDINIRTINQISLLNTIVTITLNKDIIPATAIITAPTAHIAIAAINLNGNSIILSNKDIIPPIKYVK